jgi:hypothetical protein
LGSFAVELNSASSDDVMPGAITPPSNAPSVTTEKVIAVPKSSTTQFGPKVMHGGKHVGYAVSAQRLLQRVVECEVQFRGRPKPTTHLLTPNAEMASLTAELAAGTTEATAATSIESHPARCIPASQLFRKSSHSSAVRRLSVARRNVSIEPARQISTRV